MLKDTQYTRYRHAHTRCNCMQMCWGREREQERVCAELSRAEPYTHIKQSSAHSFACFCERWPAQTRRRLGTAFDWEMSLFVMWTTPAGHKHSQESCSASLLMCPVLRQSHDFLQCKSSTSIWIRFWGIFVSIGSLYDFEIIFCITPIALNHPQALFGQG